MGIRWEEPRLMVLFSFDFRYGRPRPHCTSMDCPSAVYSLAGWLQGRDGSPDVRVVTRRFALHSIVSLHASRRNRSHATWKLRSNRTPYRALSSCSPQISSSPRVCARVVLVQYNVLENVLECIRMDDTEPAAAGLDSEFLELHL